MASLKTLQESPLEISPYHSNRIVGTVNLQRNQRVSMITIPVAKGQHVKVDDKSTTPQTVFNMFMATLISPGKHRVGFYYRSPLLTLGPMITVVSLGLIGWRVEKEHQARTTLG